MKYDPFEALAGRYSKRDVTLSFYTRIQSLVGRDSVMLDLGAGRAAWFEEDPIRIRREVRTFKGKVAKIYACDVDEAVLTNQSVDECLLQRDSSIPMKANYVDVVIADYVLEHIDDPLKFSSEVDRILKPGGWFCARTPHKYNYVSIAARLVPNETHARTLTSVQPDRKELDVFPTAYQLNTFTDIKNVFRDYDDFSYIAESDPAYYFNKKSIYLLLSCIHAITPKFFSGNMLVFLRKPN